MNANELPLVAFAAVGVAFGAPFVAAAHVSKKTKNTCAAARHGLRNKIASHQFDQMERKRRQR